jgi:hypothetical protein
VKYITISLFSILILSILVYFGLTYLKPTQSLTKVEVQPSQIQENIPEATRSSEISLDEDLTILDRDLSESTELDNEFNTELKAL